MLDFWVAKTGRLTRQGQVTGNRQATATAHGIAIDGRDDWLAHLLDQALQFSGQRGTTVYQRLIVGCKYGEFACVGTGTKAAAGSSDDDRAYAVVGIGGFQCCYQAFSEGEVQGIEFVGTVQGDGLDAVSGVS
ncbi:hypothetical protein D3C80_1725620 [compost metagenome]